MEDLRASSQEEDLRAGAQEGDGAARDKPARDRPAAREKLAARARVVIIGGGLAGMATAHALTAARVSDVLVLEREAACGYHASGRNAALGRQLTEDDAVTALTLRGAAFLRNPPAGFSETRLWAQTGSVLLVDRAEELERLCARATRWELLHEVVGARELVAGWPVLEGVPMAGGVRFPTDGVIDVHALLQGFQRGARGRGARVEVGCEVLGGAHARRQGGAGREARPAGAAAGRDRHRARLGVPAHVAPDRRPVIGWDADAPGLFWVAGLGGHGATGSAAVGQRAATLVLERIG